MNTLKISILVTSMLFSIGTGMAIAKPSDYPVMNFGSSGSGLGQYNRPLDVEMPRPQGKWTRDLLYVAERSNHRVQILYPTMKPIKTWKAPGNGSNLQIYPEGVVATSSNVFVLDGSINMIHKYTLAGSPVKSWGTDNGEFGIALNSTGSLLTSEVSFGTPSDIDKWSQSGSNTASFGIGINKYIPDLTVDSMGKIFALDAGTDDVLVFSSTGKLIDSWKVNDHSCGIASDKYDNVYVHGSGQITKYSNSGTLLGKRTVGIDKVFSGPAGTFNKCGLTVYDKYAPKFGLIYMASPSMNRIQVINTAGI